MKLFLINLHNLFLFILGALRYGTPLWLWRKAWTDIKKEHLAQVRKKIWELKVQGKVREDTEGRLWPVKED